MSILTMIQSEIPASGVNYGPDSPKGVPMMLDGGQRGIACPAYVHNAWMDGHDEGSLGDMSGIMGHWFRYERFLVHTDEQGHVSCYQYATQMDIEVVWEYLEKQDAALDAYEESMM